MSESVPYDGNKLDKRIKLEDFLKTEDDTDIGYFVECELEYLDIIKKPSVPLLSSGKTE